MSTKAERARNRRRRSRKRTPFTVADIVAADAVLRANRRPQVDGAYVVDCSPSLNRWDRLAKRAYHYQGGRKAKAAQRRLEGNSRQRQR